MPINTIGHTCPLASIGTVRLSPWLSPTSASRRCFTARSRLLQRIASRSAYVFVAVGASIIAAFALMALEGFPVPFEYQYRLVGWFIVLRQRWESNPRSWSLPARCSICGSFAVGGTVWIRTSAHVDSEVHPCGWDCVHAGCTIYRLSVPCALGRTRTSAHLGLLTL